MAVRRTVRGRDLRPWGFALTVTALAAPAQVVVSLLSDGSYELAEHEVFLRYLTWLALAPSLGGLGELARVNGDRTRAGRLTRTTADTCTE